MAYDSRRHRGRQYGITCGICPEVYDHFSRAQHCLGVVFSAQMVRNKPFVLVLEDDPVSAEALTLVLQDWGAEVAHAAHATHVDGALGDRADELHFIIADYDLGDGPNGVAIASDLLSTAQRARVLVLSGTLRARSDIAARNAGFAMMQKPARADAIVAWLEGAE